MTRYRFYIIDIMDGIVKGTDQADVASDYSHSEDCFVVDTESGSWLAFGEPMPVPEV